jgi:ATP dependent DNA ligase domain
LEILSCRPARLWEGQAYPLVYYAFDLLSLDSADLRSRPLTQRRKLLAKLLKKAPGNIKFCEELPGTKEELLRVAKQFQLEGLIAKRPDSLYEPGRRSGAWFKFKLARAARVRYRRLPHQMAAENTLALCLWVTTGPKHSFSPVELVPAFPKELWRPCTMASRRSGERCALSSTCL